MELDDTLPLSRFIVQHATTPPQRTIGFSRLLDMWENRKRSVPYQVFLSLWLSIVFDYVCLQAPQRAPYAAYVVKDQASIKGYGPNIGRNAGLREVRSI